MTSFSHSSPSVYINKNRVVDASCSSVNYLIILLFFKNQDPGVMSTRKRRDLRSLCLYGNALILFFYFASAFTDPLDGN